MAITLSNTEFGIGDGPFELTPGSHTLSFTATDECGNSASCNYVVTVIDDVSPIAICNDEIIVALDGNGDGQVCTSVLDAGSYDNCGIDSMQIRRMDSCMADGAGTTFDDCTPVVCCDLDSGLMVILGVWDSVGNYNECMVEVMVQDKIDPEIICPPDLTLECDLYPIPDTMGGSIITIPSGEQWPPATQDGINGYAYDNCLIDSISMSVTDNVDACTREGTVIRTFIVTDSQGQTNSCTQSISFLDTTPPLITFPDSMHVSCEVVDDLNETGTATAEDNCTNYLITFDDLPPLTFPDDLCSYKIIRTWKVFNDCTNELTTADQIILVTDDEPPVFGLPPGDVTLNNLCQGDPLPVEPVGGVTDNCGTPEIDILEDITVAGNCLNNFTVQRIWQATDECGQTATISQNITIVDITPPVLSNLPDNVTINCGEPIEFNNITASDNCGGIMDITFSDVTTPGDCEDNSIVTRTWSVSDACGLTTTASRDIVIEDTTAPTFINFPDDLIFDCNEQISFPANPEATDNCDNDVDVLFDDTPMDSPSCPAESFILRRFIAVDNCGNTSQRTLTIFIADLFPPVIDGVPNDVTLECDETLPGIANVTITDNCSTNINNDFTETTIDGICPFNYILTRTWTATDECDNTTSSAQNITVVDSEPPVFSSIPPNLTIACEEMIPAVPNLTATDNCTGNIATINFTQEQTAGSCNNNITITRNWTAQDVCGNIATLQQVIEIVDEEAPQISNVPLDTTISCTEIDNFPEPNFSDNCTTPPTIMEQNDTIASNCMNNYTIVRTWTAIDECNNSSTVSTTITVEDNEAPVLTCPDDDVTFTVGAQSNDCDEMVILTPIATDNCDDNVEIEARLVNINPDLGNNLDMIITPNEDGEFNFRFPLDTTTVTFTATDDCGLSSSCTMTVFVNEITRPQVECMGLTFFLEATGIKEVELTDFSSDGVSLPYSDVCSPIISAVIEPDTVTCEDLFDFETATGIPISLTVIDYWGNTSICSTVANVFEADADCPNNINIPESETFVLGSIRTEDLTKVENVPVYIEEDMEAMHMSNASGNYLFRELQIGNDYRMKPYKNDDPTNGVTTYDLVLLQKHILNITPLNSPYKKIAADINNSGSITTYDAVLLRRLILNIDTAFTENTSWRFVTSDYTFPDPEDPFAEPCPEEIEFTNIQQYIYNADFIAVKIGDLNASATVNFSGANALRNEKEVEDFEIAIPSEKASKGESILVTIQANDYEEITALQFGLKFDSNMLAFQGIANDEQSSVFAGLDEDNFGLRNVDQGMLNFAWTTVASQELYPDATLFTLRFRAKKDLVNITKHFDIAQRAIPAVIYKKDGKPMNIVLKDHKMFPTDNGELVLYPNAPNPFDNSTLIRFVLPGAGKVTLNIMDVNGKMLKAIPIHATQGFNQHVLDAAIFPTSGVYHYLLKTDFGTRSSKLVLIR